jgi:hypothetical protein
MEYSYIHQARMGNLEFFREGFGRGSLHHFIPATEQELHRETQMLDGVTDRSNRLAHGEKGRGRYPGVHERIFAVGGHLGFVVGEEFWVEPRGDLQIIEHRRNMARNPLLQLAHGA